MNPQCRRGELLRQLAPELQIILFERHDYFCIDGGDRFLGKLEHRASMDSLACLTILKFGKTSPKIGRAVLFSYILFEETDQLQPTALS